MNVEENKSNDLQEIIAQAIEQMRMEKGASFDIAKINLMELSRRTGISRGRLRRIRKNGFKVLPHGRTGMKAETTVLTGFTGVIDNLLMSGVTNSAVCFERIKELGYTGGLTQIKMYIAEHRDLVPPKRLQVAPQGNRGRRYTTHPGEAYQMDWGFVNVETDVNSSYKAACFAMICHHCGERYIEFFPNAKQENLFIGMIHGFVNMGIPERVLTDNMKSVVIRRDAEGKPIWNREYEAFMDTVGFNTTLCKPRHPFTKGAVERLVRFVKGNFLAGRVFGNLTDLNYEALRWCRSQNGRYHKSVDCIPAEEHLNTCRVTARDLVMDKDIMYYLCPARRISFDGFVNYEGRRFGVPYRYHRKICRIKRSEYTVTIYSEDMSEVLTTHNVTWSRRDSFCKDQYAFDQPEEHPSMPVQVKIRQLEPPQPRSGFEKFRFGGGVS